ncbi:MAG TPA: hypothetical protein VHF23_08550 [Gaiellaceae bacterium]|nr:hypothetical protein [Gaiellaceae bacterium]
MEGCTAAAWRSTATARPSAGTAVEVLTREGAVASRVLDACAPAWRPDGALTYVRDGELWLRPGEGPDHVVISGRDLASAVGPRAELEEVAWVDDRRLWAVVRHRREAVLVRFHDRIGSVVFRARAVEGLRVDRDGALAARTAGDGVTFFDPAGRRLLSVSGEAVSWAPAGHVAAVAGRREIAFVAPGARRVERLALVATDLEWLPSR